MIIGAASVACSLLFAASASASALEQFKSFAAGTKSAKGEFVQRQVKKADASGARYALVFGADELARGAVTVKPLRDSGEQAERPLAALAEWAATLQSSR